MSEQNHENEPILPGPGAAAPPASDLGWARPRHHRSLLASHKIGHCLSDWIINENKTKCFKCISDLKSWDESEAYCKDHRGHLASVSSLQELKFVQDLCRINVDGCWIGGRGQSTSGHGWMWSDHKSLHNDSFLPKVQHVSNCGNLSCNNGSDSCSLLSDGAVPIKAVGCNHSHAFICTVDTGNQCYGGQCQNLYIIILAVVSGGILCATLAVVVWLLVYRRSKRRRRSRRQSNLVASSLVPPSWKVFTIEELKSISKNFSEGNRLPGESKTGGTYSGILADGSKVAIKKLKRSNYQRKKEFYSEVGRVARLHHPSLVSVKGCCYNHGHRYIVYEFIVNGPLDRWLHHVPRGGRCLSWPMRMKIATTLAQGIAFLHDKVKPQVVHRDIRASNVLLDEEFGAHLMGVGLAKFVPWEVMQERTVMAGGTHGYLAPEFVYRNELTTKSDVYSFGVLLLEIVSGRRLAQAVDSGSLQSIFEWATPLVQSHRYPDLLDPVISSSSSEIPEAGAIQKVVDLVYSCTQNLPSMRPRMSHVVHQLQQLVPSAPAVEQAQL
ncbi:C-type lectin receptor-like tyrosine-protein kinase At1g52310 [Chenopodium quinoa]|uniref:C-type lectin receptor-like tyrosine-protein kinase At1g52310 n=1 Tax=Chenopodium quinoa TaxID=63459 RepID=UPI000B79A4A9|nr:C-type lectin receptor-like tyrosine-protein kinase At1g52310 [Chenopodium quinoa]XP_021730784.1 C-type lectin receptor-like tyrosine-protein kinase At1g52310 [Chenopodium quinoa]